jgi:hypothetical protein
MKQRVWWFVLIFLFMATPAGAQQFAAEDWIPADFAGFVRLDMEDAEATLLALNAAGQSVSVIQPARFGNARFEGMSYENLLPLGLLFDVEDASFVQDVLPWLSGDIVVAYRQFEAPLTTDESNILMIMPTNDAFLAANRMSRIIQGQQRADAAVYRGVTLSIGDKSTIAVTPEVVLVGGQELVQAALDLHAGEGERMTAQPDYQAIQSAASDDALVFGYIPGENASGILSALLNTQTTTDPLLAVAGEALRGLRGEDALDTALLTGSIHSAGFVLKPVLLRPVIIEANLLLNTDIAAHDSSALDTTMLDLIPRNAVIVHQGTDVQAVVHDVMVALPLSNFGGRMFGAFPVNQSLGTSADFIEDPSAAEVQAAVNGFITSLNTLADFDLEADFLNHLSGGYTVALLSTPNRPVALLNTPFKTLILVQVEDGEAALAGATRLVEMMLGVEELPTEEIEGYTFTAARVGAADDAVIRLGLIDNTLVIVTGDALEDALDAQRGDNRLINEARWQLFTQNGAAQPELYVDINAYFNMLSLAGGSSFSQSLFRGLVANTDYLGSGVYSINLRMTIP